jgi:hypothetical protein
VVIGSLAILAIMATFDIVSVLSGFDSTKALDWPLLILLPLTLICSFFAIGITVLWLGMIWDCAFSKMPIGARIAWLVLLVLTCTLGALVYYFCVYNKRRSEGALAKGNPLIRA